MWTRQHRGLFFAALTFIAIMALGLYCDSTYDPRHIALAWWAIGCAALLALANVATYLLWRASLLWPRRRPAHVGVHRAARDQ